MKLIILKGDTIIESAHNLAGACIAAKQYLPKGFKTGDDLPPSKCISIWELVKHYGDKID